MPVGYSTIRPYTVVLDNIRDDRAFLLTGLDGAELSFCRPFGDLELAESWTSGPWRIDSRLASSGIIERVAWLQ